MSVLLGAITVITIIIATEIISPYAVKDVWLVKMFAIAWMLIGIAIGSLGWWYK